MTHEETQDIQKMLEGLKIIGERLAGDKEASLKFLIEAGIINKRKAYKKKAKRVQQSPPRNHRLPQLQ